MIKTDLDICRCGPSRQQKVRGRPAGARTGAGATGAAPPRRLTAATATTAGQPRTPCAPPPAGMPYKLNLNAHMPAASLNAAGSVHSPSTSMATSSQYHQLLSDYGGHPLATPRELGRARCPKANMLSCWPSSKSWGKRSDPPTQGARAP